MSDQARITELESRVAFLEHTLDAVNRSLLELEKARSRQHHELDQLRNRMTELAEGAGAPPADPPPPHY